MNRMIPQSRWREELTSFSQQHDGWIVSVSSQGRDGAIGFDARNMRLRDISVGAPQANEISVEVGGPNGHSMHDIRDVTSVAVDVAGDGIERGLVIESADGSTTTVTFRSAIRPDEVDGIAEQR